MKQKLKALVLACTLAAVAHVLFSGCATTSTGTPLTAEQKSQLIDDTALLIRSAARNGAQFAIEDDPGSARWFAFAQQSIATFLTGKDYSPVAFQQALNAVPVKEFKEKWIKYAIYTVADLYQIYYGRYVLDAVKNNDVAAKFLQAVQDGFKQAADVVGVAKPAG